MLTIDSFITARAAMGRHLTERRAERFARPIHGPEYDSGDMIGDLDDPPTAPLAFHFIYEDSRNNLSGRCFTLRALRREISEIRLSGYCHFRRQIRTFLASRLVEVTDLATGEVFEDGLEYFENHPMLAPLTGRTLGSMSPCLQALQECRDEVILLSFIAGADGEFVASEEDQIVIHVLNRAPDPDLTEEEVRRRVRCFVPDELAFDRALNRMCAGGGDAKSLMRAMRRVIDADGIVDIAEIAFAEEIERRLREAGRL